MATHNLTYCFNLIASDILNETYMCYGSAYDIYGASWSLGQIASDANLLVDCYNYAICLNSSSNISSCISPVATDTQPFNWTECSSQFEFGG